VTAAEILRNARKLIEKPETWCKGAMVRRRGDMIYPGPTFSPEDGDQYCALGALCVGGPPDRGPGFFDAREILYGVNDAGSVLDLNDGPHTTHADVLALFDKAIAAAEAVS
jgi:hypothetical protein